MAKRRAAAKPKLTKEQKEEAETTMWVAFKGGPRQGFRLQVGKNLMREYLRFGYPEWATYRWDEEQTLYVYEGTAPAPPGAGLVRKPVVAAQSIRPKVEIDLSTVDRSYRDSPGWKRGRRMAEDTMAGLL